MKIITLNLQSGLGVTKGYWQYPLAYFARDPSRRKEYIARAAEYLESQHADLILLTEVDGGSRRTDGDDQLEATNRHAKGHAMFFPSARGRSYNQGNAIISRQPIISQSHFNLPGRRRTPRYSVGSARLLTDRRSAASSRI